LQPQPAFLAAFLGAAAAFLAGLAVLVAINLIEQQGSSAGKRPNYFLPIPARSAGGHGERPSPGLTFLIG
jgi:hypothetical protein